MPSSSLSIRNANQVAAYKAIFIDVFALAFIYFLPAISHLAGIKLYLAEPMRMMLIIALAHTHRKNAYILALSLPLFSFLVSAHPVLIKTGLISVELLINVSLFFFLSKRMHNFAAIFVSIWVSKLIYYGLKYLAMLWILPPDILISTPVSIQLITSSVFSMYLYLMFQRRG